MFATNRIVALKLLTTAVLALIPICLAPSALFGATFNIPDGDVAGLIAAIQASNTNGQADVIDLAPNGTYVLTAIAEDNGSWGPTGLPYVRSQITINGNGAVIQRSSAPGVPTFRIMFVDRGKLTLNEVTLTGGACCFGGGLGVNFSEVLVRNSTITGNTGDQGGGIGAWCSNLTLLNSTVSYNTDLNNGYGGGGILQFEHNCPPANPTTHISFSTILENRNDGWGRGDAIATYFGSPGSIQVKNSILASPTRGAGGACWISPNALVSHGHNIAGDDCGLTGFGDINSTNPLLALTLNNGGLTPTSLPLPGSPAIDGVPLAHCTDIFNVPITADQRGVARPKGTACDIGAVEIDQDATPPLVSAQLSANPSPLGSTITLTAIASDVNSGNSNIVSVQYSLDSGTTWQTFAGTYGSPTVLVSTNLMLPKGVYGVCVRAADTGQNTSGPSCTDVLAVYDPSGGFVTGGGWINSPQGAYTPNPSLVGRASFGFVSKYQNAAATPAGETQFQFNAGSFRFKSTAYDWLVIAGARAQYKGTGMVNGAGEYGFMLTAIDGDANGGGYVDKFRIKIWTVTDGSVVYDNQLGAFEGADPVTALGGGSIVIHR